MDFTVQCLIYSHVHIYVAPNQVCMIGQHTTVSGPLCMNLNAMKSLPQFWTTYIRASSLGKSKQEEFSFKRKMYTKPTFCVMLFANIKLITFYE